MPKRKRAKPAKRWLVGDVHGCREPMSRLLKGVAKRETQLDGSGAPPRELWFAGDLVNRGPDSAGSLDRVRELVEAGRARTVLGNHDLHLLARAAGIRDEQRSDTLEELLAGEPRAGRMEWLRRQPLLIRDGSTLLVHAGLLPRWSVEEAEEAARAVEKRLAAEDWRDQLARLYEPRSAGDRRRSSALKAFTLLRGVDAAGEPLRGHKGPPDELPKGSYPWFAHPERRWAGSTVLFGHWAGLGLHFSEDAVCSDAGCVWGRKLAAIAWPEREVLAVPSEPG